MTRGVANRVAPKSPRMCDRCGLPISRLAGPRARWRHIECEFSETEQERIFYVHAGGPKPVPARTIAKELGVSLDRVKAAIDAAMRRRGLLR